MTIGEVLGFLLIGCIVGPLARFIVPGDDPIRLKCPNVPDCLRYFYAALPARGAELHGGDDLIPGVSNASGNEADVLERLDDLAGGLQQPVVTVGCSIGGFEGAATICRARRAAERQLKAFGVELRA